MQTLALRSGINLVSFALKASDSMQSLFAGFLWYPSLDCCHLVWSVFLGFGDVLKFLAFHPDYECYLSVLQIRLGSAKRKCNIVAALFVDA